MTMLPSLAVIGRRRVLRHGQWLSVAFRPRVQRRVFLILALIALVMAIIVPMGTYDLAPDRVWAALLHPSHAAADEILIVWEFRVPRILLAVVAGAMLAVAGALMQSVTRNGLADPGLIGVTEGATIVMLLILFLNPGLAMAWRPALGMLGAAAVAGFVLLLTSRVESVRFVLIGIGVSAFLSAVISIFLTYGEITRVQAAMVWMSGSLSPASWKILWMLMPWALIGLAVSFVIARATDAGLLGESAATSLGVRTAALRIVLIVISVALTSASVAAIGTLGFVGLIAPHMARFLVGASQSALIGGSAVCGAALVLFADSLGRLPFAPIQIPAGIVMAMIGVPFFLLLLWRRRHSL